MSGYIISEGLLQYLFNEYQPHISALLNDNTNRIVLKELKIYEYGQKDNLYVVCYPKTSGIGLPHIELYFEISRSLINLLGYFWRYYAAISEEYTNIEKITTDLDHPGAIQLQRKIAVASVKAIKGKKIKNAKIKDSSFTFDKLSNFDKLYEGFFQISLEFLICHEIGHAILKFEDYKRTEYDDAIAFIKANGYDDEKIIKTWAKEFASDYLALKLFTNRWKTADNDLFNWPLIILLMHLTPFEKNFTHPPQHLRVYFLYEKTSPEYQEKFLKSCLINLKFLNNIESFIEEELAKEA